MNAAAAIAAALLLMFSPPACSPVPAGAPPKKCDLRFTPSSIPWIEKGSIHGRVAVWCADPPASHHLEVWLEWRSPDLDWLRFGDIVVSDDIPGPTPTAYTVVTSCAPGVYRVAAWVTGSSGGKPYDLKDHSSRTLAVSSSDCP